MFDVSRHRRRRSVRRPAAVAAAAAIVADRSLFSPCTYIILYTIQVVLSSHGAVYKPSTHDYIWWFRDRVNRWWILFLRWKRPKIVEIILNVQNNNTNTPTSNYKNIILFLAKYVLNDSSKKNLY